MVACGLQVLPHRHSVSRKYFAAPATGCQVKVVLRGKFVSTTLLAGLTSTGAGSFGRGETCRLSDVTACCPFGIVAVTPIWKVCAAPQWWLVDTPLPCWPSPKVQTALAGATPVSVRTCRVMSSFTTGLALDKAMCSAGGGGSVVLLGGGGGGGGGGLDGGWVGLD